MFQNVPQPLSFQLHLAVLKLVHSRHFNLNIGIDVFMII